jgi:hypothetical protein
VVDVGGRPPAAIVGVGLIAIAAGVAFVAGWRWRVSGPVFALLFLALTTHRLSWGQVLHTEHLAALHLLVVGFSGAAVSRDRSPHPRFGWPVRVMAVLTVTTYVVAGVAKVRHGGADWLVGDVLRNWVAHDNLRKELLGDVHSPLGGWLVGYGWVFVPLALLTVAIELAAPIALLGGRLRTVWVILAWSFHVGIAALMAIVFPYQLLGVAFAPLFRCERVWYRTDDAAAEGPTSGFVAGWPRACPSPSASARTAPTHTSVRTSVGPENLRRIAGPRESGSGYRGGVRRSRPRPGR